MCIRDRLLFFVFFDLSLVGMYFLIGIWGHGDAQRSALKFFLYTLVGSLALLLGILGIYLNTAPRTFDMIEIIRTQPLPVTGLTSTCLLYTSDATDDLTRVDLGGRRIIKK